MRPLCGAFCYTFFMKIETFDMHGNDIAVEETHSYNTAMVRSLNIIGLDVQPIEIEVDVSQGMPHVIIVGLPDTAVAEARDRVRTAIKNAGFQFPRTRVTVNLAPAHVRKIGSLFDLPIALGILMASGQIPEQPICAIGELSLNGDVRGVHGALPLVHAATTQLHIQELLVPADNSDELHMISSQAKLYAVTDLQQVVHHLNGHNKILPLSVAAAKNISYRRAGTNSNDKKDIVDLGDITGQAYAKRALLIAAAGGHNILLSGAPGVGKSMLAQVLPTILPEPTRNEMLEINMIHSVARGTRQLSSTENHTRPFRAPHHSASTVAIVGGGTALQPGELSLAHNGVLFLDELPEFKREVIEALRQPLEEGSITINRSHGRATYPARTLLIAAMNPCPCGYAGIYSNDPDVHIPECTCSAYIIQRYQQKLSGPLLDRIDIKVSVSYVPPHLIQQKHHQSLKESQHATHTSAHAIAAATAARARQYTRQQCVNAYISSKQIQQVVRTNTASQQLLQLAMKRNGLSMRGYIKTLKVARTIADLDNRGTVIEQDIAEALSYTAGFESSSC